MANLNLNYTSSAGFVPVETEQYMFRNFLDRVINNRVYGRDHQLRTLPPHNGKRVQFNKMNPFPVSLVPLREGVTPDGQTITTSSLTATVKPYGNYVSFTDETDWALIDGIKRETSLRLGDQAADTLDAIDREAMMSGTNIQNSTSTNGLLTYAEIKKAVRTLEINKAKPFPDGFYHAIIGPEAKFDLMSDSMWVDIAKYQDTKNLERGEVGKMYKVKFFETTNPKVYAAESYLYETTASLAATGYDATNKIIKIAKSTISATSNTEDIAYFARLMAGKPIFVCDANGGASSSAKNIKAVIDHVSIGVDTNVLVYLRWIAENYSYESGDTIVPYTEGDATNGYPHATIVYGQDFSGGVSLGDGGKNVEMIIKPLGSSGTDDPLNQRSTVAWKVKGYTATVLQDAFGVRILHKVSQ